MRNFIHNPEREGGLVRLARPPAPIGIGARAEGVQPAAHIHREWAGGVRRWAPFRCRAGPP